MLLFRGSLNETANMCALKIYKIVSYRDLIIMNHIVMGVEYIVTSLVLQVQNKIH